MHIVPVTAVCTSLVSYLLRTYFLTIRALQTPFGLDNPRRIVYDPHASVFAVACTRIEPAPVFGEEVSKGSFKLLDDITFERECLLPLFFCPLPCSFIIVVGEVPFAEGTDQMQEITAIHAFQHVEGNIAISHYCVGLVTYQLDEKEPSHGELHIFSKGGTEPHGAGKADLLEVVKQEVSGCVYALASFEGYIVAAINSSVRSHYSQFICPFSATH